MTIAEQLEKKGKKEGKIEDAKNMLREDIELERIARITGLSADRIKEIKRNISE